MYAPTEVCDLEEKEMFHVRCDCNKLLLSAGRSSCEFSPAAGTEEATHPFVGPRGSKIRIPVVFLFERCKVQDYCFLVLEGRAAPLDFCIAIPEGYLAKETNRILVGTRWKFPHRGFL